MEVIIREIEEKDYQFVLSLWNNELGMNYVTAEHVVRYYESEKNNAHYKTFVALLGEDVVGIMSTVQIYAVGFDGNYMQITAAAVKNEKQNKGIGTKLFRQVESYAKEAGCYGIGVCSGFKRTAAHKFYEHNGLVKGSYAFHKGLND